MSNDEIVHSKKNIASYGFGRFLAQFLSFAFNAYVLFYYESELGLASWLVGLGFIIFAVWNAINDPILGYFVDRPFKFTKKRGRRFPWIMIGGILWIFSYVLIFTPPSVDPQEGALILFGWLVFATCLYDTCFSLFSINLWGLFPDKFTSSEERRTAGGLTGVIGTAGVFFGAMVPPMFIKFGDPQSYIIQAGVMILISVIILVLAIPGCRDDQIRVDRYLKKWEEGMERESFLKTFKMLIKHKNFVAYQIVMVFYLAAVTSMIASVPYLTRYILKMEAGAITLLMLGYLIGTFIGIPVITKVANKVDDNTKVMAVTGVLLAISIFPFYFLVDYMTLFVVFIFMGICVGAYWALLTMPLLSDVIDEGAVIMGKRSEGIYQGAGLFIQRAAWVVATVAIVGIHILTGFVEGAETQSAEAVWGIQVHFGLLPAIFALISALAVWKLIKLSPEKIQSTQAKLKELGL